MTSIQLSETQIVNPDVVKMSDSDKVSLLMGDWSHTITTPYAKEIMKAYITACKKGQRVFDITTEENKIKEDEKEK